MKNKLFTNTIASAALIAAFALFAACGSSPQAAAPAPTSQVTSMDLDAAAKEAAAQIDKKIPQGTKVALVSLASPSAAFSEQVMLRLESALVSSGKVIVVDRANLDKIRAEQGFQLSGEVDDDSAKAIGKLLGAGAIVTGSTVDMGDVYGLALKAINIETATVAVSYLAELTKTERIKMLMASGGGTQPATAAKTPPAAAASASTAQTAPATPAAAASTAQTAPAAPPPPAPVEPPKVVVYKVGDKGPAGGIVFFDKESNSNGWRYLEAAPKDFSIKVEWGADNTDVSGTQTGLGNGKRNTEIIVSKLNSRGEMGRAAQVCAELTTGGFTDWFLPSKDELDLMYNSLKQKGGFNDGNYWSSSQLSNQPSYAWCQNFGNGNQNGYGAKSNTFSVRAIRAF